MSKNKVYKVLFWCVSVLPFILMGLENRIKGHEIIKIIINIFLIVLMIFVYKKRRNSNVSMIEKIVFAICLLAGLALAFVYFFFINK